MLLIIIKTFSILSLVSPSNALSLLTLVLYKLFTHLWIYSYGLSQSTAVTNEKEKQTQNQAYKVQRQCTCCIFRPHRSTTYVDAAYSYRQSSVVCWSVTLVSPAQTAAPIELPFGLRTWVGPGNYVLDGGPDPPWQIFGGRMGVPLQSMGTLYRRLCKDG